MSSLVDWEPDYNYETIKYNKTPEECSRIFAKRFGNLTVEQVIELNNKAKETCAWEITSQVEEV